MFIAQSLLNTSWNRGGKFIIRQIEPFVEHSSYELFCEMFLCILKVFSLLQSYLHRKFHFGNVETCCALITNRETKTAQKQ